MHGWLILLAFWACKLIGSSLIVTKHIGCQIERSRIKHGHVIFLVQIFLVPVPPQLGDQMGFDKLLGQPDKMLGEGGRGGGGRQPLMDCLQSSWDSCYIVFWSFHVTKIED